MKRAGYLLALVAAICCAGVMRAAQLDGSVFLMPIDSQFTSVGRAEYLNDLNHRTSAALSGTHSVHGPQVFETPVEGDGLYTYDLQGPAAPGACYGTTLHVIGDPPYPLPELEKTWSGSTRCAPTSDKLPDKDLPDGSGGSSTTPHGSISPILIDLDDDGFELTGLDQSVLFDLDADGVADRISWTAHGVADAFLVLDRNGNHAIDDGQEMFGNATRLASGAAAGNGYLALREHDENRDGVIDASDAVWTSLQVWTDRNHDAVSQSWELMSVALAGIHVVDTRYSESRRTDRYSNLFRFKSRALVNDKRGEAHASKTYDVFFVEDSR